jgi:uncharacterized protein with HEPN domain
MVTTPPLDPAMRSADAKPACTLSTNRPRAEPRRCIEIIGEAAARVGSDARNRLPQIPWTQIVGARNRLVHAYFDLDLDQIWNTVTRDLPPLVVALEGILQHEPPPPEPPV